MHSSHPSGTVRAILHQGQTLSAWPASGAIQRPNGHLNGAALILDNGRELPITDAMIEHSLQQLVQG